MNCRFWKLFLPENNSKQKTHIHKYTHTYHTKQLNQKICPWGSGPVLVRDCPRILASLRTTICRLISIAWTVIGSRHLWNLASGDYFKGKARRLGLRYKSHLAWLVLCLTQNWYLKIKIIKTKVQIYHMKAWIFVFSQTCCLALGDACSLAITPLSRAHQAPSLLYYFHASLNTSMTLVLRPFNKDRKKKLRKCKLFLASFIS